MNGIFGSEYPQPNKKSCEFVFDNLFQMKYCHGTERYQTEATSFMCCITLRVANKEENVHLEDKTKVHSHNEIFSKNFSQKSFRNFSPGKSEKFFHC